jgi:predicted RecA/RadA family phage recombinase
MATNKIQEGKILRLTVASTVKANDPVVVGNAIRGVALTDYDSGDAKASVEIGGVWDLSVQAKDDAGNSAVAVGDRLYYAGSASPYLSKKKTGKFFGIALETVTSGETATINVFAGDLTGPDRASHTVIAAGIHTVADSPLDTSELISVTGILATDVVLATMSVNGGSPKVNIVSAVAQASPAGIVVTADGTFTTGDKINYAVLRAAL